MLHTSLKARRLETRVATRARPQAVGKLAVAAARWTNQDCATAKEGFTPPEATAKSGKLIDFNHRGVAHFGELAKAPVASQKGVA